MTDDRLCFQLLTPSSSLLTRAGIHRTEVVVYSHKPFTDLTGCARQYGRKDICPPESPPDILCNKWIPVEKFYSSHASSYRCIALALSFTQWDL